MLETLAALFTILTGAWFVFDKARTFTVRGKSTPKQLPVPAPAEPIHGDTLEAIAATLADDPRQYKLFQPHPQDDPISAAQLGPWIASGDFFGTGRPAHALYVKNSTNGGFSLIVVGAAGTGKSSVHTLDSDIASARFMYVESARPGRYRVSPVIYKHGGPKAVRIRSEGILSATYESAARLFWWDRKRSTFAEQWLSD